MPAIFISYRRDDTQGWAGRFTNELQAAFGEEPIFFDLASIAPGEDFVAAIEKAVRSCRSLVALIGPRWLDARSREGKRRLLEADDLVRIEIRTALDFGLTVIPVLLGDAAPPPPADLPDDIKALARRNAFELSESRWRYDCDRLLQALEAATGLDRCPAAQDRATTSVSVLDGAVLQDTETGAIAGVVSDRYPLPNSQIEVDVARGARITGAKVGDITGVIVKGTPKDVQR